MIRWHIGCSGFYYKHWKDIFYPEGLSQKKWFSFYVEHFGALELNATFYRTPTAGELPSHPTLLNDMISSTQSLYYRFHGRRICTVLNTP